MDTKLIREAADGLHLVDIYLLDFNFEAHKDYHPSIVFEGDSFKTQDKKEIKCKKAIIVDENGEKTLFLIEALLGIRALDDKEGNDEILDAVFTIEAKFRAEYLIKAADLSEEALKEFSRHNGLHAIWPFWRQFVYDMMPRLRLPIPEVPLRSPLYK